MDAHPCMNQFHFSVPLKINAASMKNGIGWNVVVGVYIYTNYSEFQIAI